MTKKRLLPLTITKAKTKDNKAFLLNLLQGYMSQDTLERCASSRALFVLLEPALSVNCFLQR